VFYLFLHGDCINETFRYINCVISTLNILWLPGVTVPGNRGPQGDITLPDGYFKGIVALSAMKFTSPGGFFSATDQT
jgi:hypothetical protein